MPCQAHMLDVAKFAYIFRLKYCRTRAICLMQRYLGEVELCCVKHICLMWQNLHIFLDPNITVSGLYA